MKISVKGLAVARECWGSGDAGHGSGELGMGCSGQQFLQTIASVYPGYHANSSVAEVIVGTLYGFVDGLIAGAVLALQPVCRIACVRIQVELLLSNFTRANHETETDRFVAIGVFLFFGAAMASLAATTLLWRGTVLDRVWTLNRAGYRQLSPLGPRSDCYSSPECSTSHVGIGWFRHRRWGWRLAVGNHRDPSPRRHLQHCARRPAARGNRSHHRRSIVALSLVISNQSRIFGRCRLNPRVLRQSNGSLRKNALKPVTAKIHV